jgi:RNA polymerase sigma-70 factor, ECF subfamily
MGAAQKDADEFRSGRDGDTEPAAALADSTVSLASLIPQIAAGDREAFRRVYDEHATRLYSVALCITRQHTLASDAVHDAFLELWRNAHRFDLRRGSPDVWLVSLVRYRALDIVRRRTREVPDDGMPEPMDDDPDPLARLTESSDAAALRGCLNALEPDRRRLILLAFRDGLSHSELAAELHMPIGTVKSSIRRSLRSLRLCLGGEA